MRHFQINRALVVTAALALTLCFGAQQARAQALDPDWNSFSGVTVTDIAKLLFQINGTDVSGSNPVGTNGTYRFGFDTNADPFTMKFADNSTHAVTGIDNIYLINQAENVTATTSSSSGQTYFYNGSADSKWAGGIAPGNGNFPDYEAGNFGGGPVLVAKGDSSYQNDTSKDRRYGDFSFTSIAGTKPIYFGFHARYDNNAKTGFFYFNGDGGGGTITGVVPEPAFYQLAGLLGLGGLGILRLRRRKA